MSLHLRSISLGLVFALLSSASVAAEERDGIDARLTRYPTLEPNVEFWVDVFAKHTSRHVIFHDPELLDIVWEVHDVSHIVDSGKSESRRAQDLKAYIDSQTRLVAARIRRLDAAKPADEGERRLAAALARHSGAKPALSILASRVRAQKGLGDRLCDSYRRAQAYLPFMRQTMTKHGVPEELAYLPLVESGYNVGAHSHKGAVGIYQFTRTTGRRYLHIDHAVDERRDPLLATEAAAKYLRANYDRLKSWPLAITAYNHGEHGMEYAVRKLGTRDLGVIVAKYDGRSFGFASRNFYAELLAAVEAMRIAGGRCSATDVAVFRRDSFRLDSAVSLRNLATAAGLSVTALVEWNPALTSEVVRGRYPVPKGYTLYLPSGSAVAFAKAYAALPKASSESVHVVRNGETLSGIASAHRTSVRTLMGLNGIRDSSRIRIGQRLRLPGASGSTATASRGRAEGSATASATSVRVQRGDSLSRLASRHGVTVAALSQINGISDPSTIRVGQVLKIPARGGARVSTHRVGKGETLSQIAALYKTTTAALQRHNGISDPTKLRSGQTLRIPH
jgi:membrane-bound lytic murein transglycosylase D